MWWTIKPYKTVKNMNCLLSKLGFNWSLVIRQLSHKTKIIGLLFKLLLNETQITSNKIPINEI